MPASVARAGLCFGVIAAAAGFAAPAWAQRADENAVTSADDAFGASVGSEQVGLYSPFIARGFSPIDAGNVRIDGLFFDLQAGLSDRLVSGWTMHVGISTQGYPFPAPTGVADYALRPAGEDAVLSTIVGYGPFNGVRAEFDGQAPLSETLSLAAGASYDYAGQYIGGHRREASFAVIPHWRPTDSVEIVPFWSLADNRDQEAQPFIFTSGAFLPPKIERRRYFGPDWTENRGQETNYGVIANVRLNEWRIRAGVFRSLVENELNFAELALNTDENGLADRFVSAQGDQRFGSVSGEVRVSRQFDETDRRHTLHAALRGREQKRRFGGGELIDLGRRPINEEINDIARPDFNFGPQTFDKVEQLTFGVGYELIWRNVGELTLGLQRSDYSKEVDAPSGMLPVSEDEPWLYNAALSIFATDDLVFYGSYARGLEESPIAPEVALNRDTAPPAILTRQFDFGLRYNLSEDFKMVAGAFEVRKPFFALDEAVLFRNLGEVRHRGLEFSASGSVTPRLYLLAGTVLLDAEVSGAAVDQGLIGKEPIGSIGRTTVAYAQYSFVKPEGLSVDVTFESTSDRVADNLNRFVVPARSVVNLGARYRFAIGKTPAMVRAQLANVFDNYGFSVLGQGFYYNFPRRFSINLTLDL